MGSRAFRRAADLTYEPGDCILEIGAERGEGSSTFLAKIAADHGIKLISIDPDPHRIHGYTGDELIQARAEDALAGWDGPHPRFVYADGADWPYSWQLCDRELMSDYNTLYRKWEGELSEDHSALSHLTAAVLLDRICERTEIVFDDTWKTPSGAYRGKGMTAVGFLQARKWRVTYVTFGIEPEDGFAVVKRP